MNVTKKVINTSLHVVSVYRKELPSKKAKKCDLNILLYLPVSSLFLKLLTPQTGENRLLMSAHTVRTRRHCVDQCDVRRKPLFKGCL